MRELERKTPEEELDPDGPAADDDGVAPAVAPLVMVPPSPCKLFEDCERVCGTEKLRRGEEDSVPPLPPLPLFLLLPGLLLPLPLPIVIRDNLSLSEFRLSALPGADELVRCDFTRFCAAAPTILLILWLPPPPARCRESDNAEVK